jgi:hypothetical protein
MGESRGAWKGNWFESIQTIISTPIPVSPDTLEKAKLLFGHSSYSDRQRPRRMYLWSLLLHPDGRPLISLKRLRSQVWLPGSKGLFNIDHVAVSRFPARLLMICEGAQYVLHLRRNQPSFDPQL